MITKFYCDIKYITRESFKQFADDVAGAKRAGDVDKAYELIAESLKP